MTPDAAHLPAQIRLIVRLIGFDLAMRLVASYGGTRLYVPRSIDADHPISQLLGLPAAQALAASRELYGDRFDVPRCLEHLTRERNRQIREDRAGGLSRRDLALKWRLTERHIDNILARPHH